MSPLRRLIHHSTQKRALKGEDKTSTNVDVRWGCARFSYFSVFDGHGVRSEVSVPGS